MSIESTYSGDLYAGLTSLTLSDDPIDLGDGVVLRKTFARFLTPLTLQNTSEESMKRLRPAFLQFATASNDIVAELVIPSGICPTFKERFDLARVITFLIRLWSNPGITLHVLSDQPFSVLSEFTDGKEPNVMPLEVYPRHFALGVINESDVLPSLVWVKHSWRAAYNLYTSSTEFKLAADALDSGQFIPNTALTLVSLWGALEAIFSPSTSELRFRVSALIASYLEPIGEMRLERQKEIAGLYDKRSAAAHGKPKHQSDDLFNTFQLLRKVIIKMINDERVPTKDELDSCLFSGTLH